MPSYIEVMYRNELKPKTEYPQRLAAYLKHRYFPPGTREVIDIGAGRLEIALALQSLGLDVSTVDREVIESPPLALRQFTCDFMDGGLPIPDDSFDCVFSKSVIEHTREPERLMREMVRILRPGGTLICLTPDWVRNKSRFYDDHTHVTPFTKISLTNLQLICGLEDVKVEYLIPLPVTWQFWPLRIVAQTVGPCVPASVNFKPLRWSRERQLVGVGTKGS